MSEVRASSLRRFSRMFLGPLAIGLLLLVLVALNKLAGIPIYNPGILLLALLVGIALTGDIAGTILSVAIALTIAIWYMVGNPQRDNNVVRIVIITAGYISVTTVVMVMRRRLVKALAAPVQAERSLFQAIMASMHDAIVETDWKGIRDVNASFCKMTGFSREELIGVMAPYPFWPVEQYASIAAAMETSMRGKALDFELVLTRKDGVRFPVLLSVSRILESTGGGKTSRVLYSFRDITELKRAQEKLQQQSRELEAAKEAAEIANRTKDRFLNLLGRELRSPLTPILTLASVLEHDTRLPAELRHDMETIRRNAETEGRLLDDMVELVHVARGVLPPEVDSFVRDEKSNPGAAPDMQPVGNTPVPGDRAATPSRKHLKILLVEDHEDTSRVLSRVLANRGHAVTTASTMHAALDAIRQHAFDFLICDIGLPDGSGLELMGKIRLVHPIPAIALSGFGAPDDIQKSRDAGFLEHLTKPVNFRILDETIDRLTTTAS